MKIKPVLQHDGSFGKGRLSVKLGISDVVLVINFYSIKDGDHLAAVF